MPRIRHAQFRMTHGRSMCKDEAERLSVCHRVDIGVTKGGDGRGGAGVSGPGALFPTKAGMEEDVSVATIPSRERGPSRHRCETGEGGD